MDPKITDNNIITGNNNIQDPKVYNNNTITEYNLEKPKNCSRKNKIIQD